MACSPSAACSSASQRCHQLVVVADADDLEAEASAGSKSFTTFGLNLHGPGSPGDMRRCRGRSSANRCPLKTQTSMPLARSRSMCALRRLGRQQHAPRSDVRSGSDEGAAVEAGDRRVDRKRIDSMAMPRGGRPLVMAKRMPRRAARRTACLRAFGQDLVRGHQRAVDIGEHQRDLAILVIGPSPCSVERPPGTAIARQQLVGRLRARRCPRRSSESRRRDRLPRHRGSAAPRASPPRWCRRAGTAWRRRSCSRRSASRSRCWARSRNVAVGEVHATPSMRTVGPGLLAPNSSEMPSSGWMRRVSRWAAGARPACRGTGRAAPAGTGW